MLFAMPLKTYHFFKERLIIRADVARRVQNVSQNVSHRYRMYRFIYDCTYFNMTVLLRAYRLCVFIIFSRALKKNMYATD